MGEDDLIAAVRAVSPPDGADVGIEVCGFPDAVPIGIRMLRIGGRYVIGGLVNPDSTFTLDGNDILRRLIKIIGVHNYHPRHLIQALDFVMSNRERFPFADIVDSKFSLDQLDEAENVITRLDDNNNNYFDNLHIKTIMAIAKGESDKAHSYIELLVNEAENLHVSPRIGSLYLELGMLEEAAYWFEKAYENREVELVVPFGPGGLTLPENLPDHPALQAALDKPELNALFEIRRKNLGLTSDSP